MIDDNDTESADKIITEKRPIFFRYGSVCPKQICGVSLYALCKGSATGGGGTCPPNIINF